jgi:hypothetical protein
LLFIFSIQKKYPYFEKKSVKKKEMNQSESNISYMSLEKHMNSSVSELYYKPKQPKVDELRKELDYEFVNGNAIKYVPVRIIETKRKSIFLA